MNSVGRKAGGNRWKRVTFEDRFLTRIDKEGPTHTDGLHCWLWLGFTDERGYGSIYYEGRSVPVHAASYRYFVGEIPKGLEIDHLCRNPSCVNPRHLEPVTHHENLMRGDTIAARRAAQTHCKRGHEFTPRNTVIDGGTRRCRLCKNARQLRRALPHVYGHMSIEDVARKMRAG